MIPLEEFLIAAAMRKPSYGGYGLLQGVLARRGSRVVAASSFVKGIYGGGERKLVLYLVLLNPYNYPSEPSEAQILDMLILYNNNVVLLSRVVNRVARYIRHVNVFNNGKVCLDDSTENCLRSIWRKSRSKNLLQYLRLLEALLLSENTKSPVSGASSRLRLMGIGSLEGEYYGESCKKAYEILKQMHIKCLERGMRSVLP